MTPRAVTAEICTITPPPPPTLPSMGGSMGGNRGISWGPREDEISATANKQLPINSAERESELARTASTSCSACE